MTTHNTPAIAPDLPPPVAADAPRAIYAFVKPGCAASEDFQGSTTVVIDVLRATTTIAAALAAGAACVRPHLSIEGVHADARTRTPGTYLTGGERGGLRIEGFDLDNSPSAYTPERVRNQTILFTSTNGTAALLHAARAERVVLAGFVNVMAVCRAIVDDPRPIRILCAGTRGQISLEDCLVAGAIVDRLSPARPLSESDGPRLCLEAWRHTLVQPGGLLRALRASRGGRNLSRLGLDADVEFSAAIDRLPVVPIFSPSNGQITLA